MIVIVTVDVVIVGCGGVVADVDVFLVSVAAESLLS